MKKPCKCKEKRNKIKIRFSFFLRIKHYLTNNIHRLNRKIMYQALPLCKFIKKMRVLHVSKKEITFA